jgi:hypothetical protein
MGGRLGGASLGTMVPTERLPFLEIQIVEVAMYHFFISIIPTHLHNCKP